MKKFTLYLLIAGFAIGGSILLGCLVTDLLFSITWQEFIRPVRKGFYSACTMAIVFYLACFLRALARYFLAKANRINREIE